MTLNPNTDRKVVNYTIVKDYIPPRERLVGLGKYLYISRRDFALRYLTDLGITDSQDTYERSKFVVNHFESLWSYVWCNRACIEIENLVPLRIFILENIVFHDFDIDEGLLCSFELQLANSTKLHLKRSSWLDGKHKY